MLNPDPKFQKKRGGFSLVGVLIMFAVMAVIGGGWLVKEKWHANSSKPMPDQQESARPAVRDFEKNTEKASFDTSNWKTYRSEKYGFEVKYPPDWFISTSSERFSTRIEPFTLGDDAATFNIFVSSSTPNWSKIEMYLDNEKVVFNFEKECKKILISDQEGYNCYIPNEFYGNNEHLIAFLKNGTLFKISDIFDNTTTMEIISTFKFFK